MLKDQLVTSGRLYLILVGLHQTFDALTDQRQAADHLQSYSVIGRRAAGYLPAVVVGQCGEQIGNGVVVFHIVFLNRR